MSGKKIFGVLALIIILTVIVKTGANHATDFIDHKIDKQIDKWASKQN